VPLVSVVIATCNRNDHVQEAIDSVLAEAYAEVELIVVDDGSADRAGELLQAKYADRVRHLRQKNEGESAARNRGIGLARGQYIAPLDSDDLWLRGLLERRLPR